MVNPLVGTRPKLERNGVIRPGWRAARGEMVKILKVASNEYLISDCHKTMNKYRHECYLLLATPNSPLPL